jgi:hypothetical protein
MPFCKVHRKFVTVELFSSGAFRSNTGQIIYILKRLVTKKNVTVVRARASPHGDTLITRSALDMAFIEY